VKLREARRAYHEKGRPMNSLDEIIEWYKRDVDQTLIEESLRRSVEERIRALEEFERFREELHAATERRRDALR
jgi:hypothetical protein